MAKKILGFGMSGWLGSKIREYLGAEATAARITESQQIVEAIDVYRPDYIINAAGIGGAPRGEDGPKNIDWCVLSKSNRQKTWHVNVDGIGLLARICADRELPLAHVSSGCIFDGDAPSAGGWTEADTPCPVSYYSETKVRGEDAARRAGGELLLIRPRLPMDKVPHPRNTISKLASYPDVMDVVNSVSVVSSLLFAIQKLIDKGATGAFHVTNPGPVSNVELMQWYQQIVVPGPQANP